MEVVEDLPPPFSLRLGPILRYDLDAEEIYEEGAGFMRTVFRGMREGPDGRPLTGPTARTLGVRPGDDLPVIAGGVIPGTGGMSVATDSPMNLPDHRRPPRFGGTGKDPLWEIDADSLGEHVRFRQDKPTHGLFEPAREMSIGEFQEALAGLASGWSKL